MEANVPQSKTAPADEVRRDDIEAHLEEATKMEVTVPLSNVLPADDARRKEIIDQMEHLWHEAGKHFQDICGTSLGLENSVRYNIKYLKDKIKMADSKVQYQDQLTQKRKREEAKSFALGLLDFLGKTKGIAASGVGVVSADCPDALLLS
jgi:hypothetical protein